MTRLRTWAATAWSWLWQVPLDRQDAGSCCVCGAPGMISRSLGLYAVTCSDETCQVSGPWRDTPDEAVTSWLRLAYLPRRTTP